METKISTVERLLRKLGLPREPYRPDHCLFTDLVGSPPRAGAHSCPRSCAGAKLIERVVMANASLVEVDTSIFRKAFSGSLR
jgi:hypothetical protein